METIETVGLYDACVKAYELGKQDKLLLNSSINSHGVDTVITQPVVTDDSVWFSTTRAQLLVVLNEYGLNGVSVDLSELESSMAQRQTEFAMYAAPVWFDVQDYVRPEEPEIGDDQTDDSEAQKSDEVESTEVELPEATIPEEIEPVVEQEQEVIEESNESEYNQEYVDSIRPEKNTNKEARAKLEEYGKTLGVDLDKRQGFTNMEKALKNHLGV